MAKAATAHAAALLACLPLLLASGISLAQVPLTGVASIALGGSHSCALTTGGGVKCWGENSFGELGNNTTTDGRTVVDVVGLSSGVTAIALGFNHTCALTNSGGVKCWGYNGYGNLGDNTVTHRHTPVDVLAGPALPPLTGVVAIAAGQFHTCALMSSGGVMCWGRNLYGQMGDLTSGIDRHTPVNVLSGPLPLSPPLLGVSAIALGSDHTCALIGDGVKCWGTNVNGQLGDNLIATSRLAPLDVLSGPALPPLAGVSAITAGFGHTCALVSGGVKCWGLNTSGQLGDTTFTPRLTPVDTVGLTTGMGMIAAGIEHTCALTSGGGAKCWGQDIYGQTSSGTYTNSANQVDVVGLTSGVSAIAAGVFHSCALSNGGGVKCWGDNTRGQLGNPPAAGAIPVDVMVLPPLALIAVQSRKTHGAAGPFNLPIDNTQPVTGPVTVEPRTIGAGHLVVFRFNNSITAPGTATTLDSNNITIATATAAGTVAGEVLVTLTGVADTSRAKISLTGVNGSATVWPASIGFLVADVNNSRAVDAIDHLAVKMRSGQITNGTNFQFDLNASGKITASDILAAKVRIGRALAL